MPATTPRPPSSEQVAVFDRTAWSRSIGISGRNPRNPHPDDAKAEIRSAVGYLLRDAAGGARGDIVQEIIAIVRQVASGLPPEQGSPLDDDMPGG
jgi:hypothetical protein